MPYITKDLRKEIIDFPKGGIIEVNVDMIGSAGDLNYVITTIIADYFARTHRKYQDINNIIGALECAKQEFYRRLVAPYEDKKIEENGDVY